MDIPQADIKTIGHLGLIVSLFKTYKIIEKVDALLPKRSNHQILTHGEVLLAMVLQGFGFASKRLYLSKEYFSHLALDDLFGPDIRPEHFNQNTLARTLDAIYKYGATQLFTDVCLDVVLDPKILKKMIFIDTTSFSVTGKHYKNKGSIKLTKGYSKDYGADLKQLVYLLVSSEDGIPILGECYSGNAVDNFVFQQKIVQIQNLILDDLEGRALVLDSSLYSKQFLRNEWITGDWITRVPESIKACKDLVSKKRYLWHKIDHNYKYFEVISKYGGRKQRWIVICNRMSRFKEQDAFKKKLARQEAMLKKKIKTLQSRLFIDKMDADIELKSIREKFPNFKISGGIVAVTRRIPKTKRRQKIGFKIKARFEQNETKIARELERKGKFVLATSRVDDSELNAEEIISAYRNRNQGIEGCFKFLKNKDLRLNQIFLKKESRIEAMLIVMTFILFINNLAQLKIRDSLNETEQTFPNQAGKGISNPTFKWICYAMRHIAKVRISIADRVYGSMKGLNPDIERIIRIFGDGALAIYGFT